MLTEFTGFTGDTNDIDYDAELCEDVEKNDTEQCDLQKTANFCYLFSPKKPEKAWRHQCILCQFFSDDTKDYNRHMTTKKHQRIVNKVSNDISDSDFECECGKTYKHKESLSRHKKSCKTNEQSNKEIINQFNNQIQTILNIVLTMANCVDNQNKTMTEITKMANTNLNNSMIANNSNNTINNTQINDNKSFNLNLFLNDTCKNAINLSDFIDEIFVTIADLERTGEIGYAGGISALFIDRLNELDQEDRPMHCSDSKRCTLFVRDNNRWEREEIARQLLLKAIKQLAAKSMKKIVDWQKLHPEHNNPESKQNDHYNQIMLNSMSGGTKEESEANYEKIFNNVVKNVVIDKKRLKFNNS
jgi:hypothetical protein